MGSGRQQHERAHIDGPSFLNSYYNRRLLTAGVKGTSGAIFYAHAREEEKARSSKPLTKDFSRAGNCLHKRGPLSWHA